MNNNKPSKYVKDNKVKQIITHPSSLTLTNFLHIKQIDIMLELMITCAKPMTCGGKGELKTM